MITFSYNINNDTVCCLAYGNGEIKDISIIQSSEKTDKDLIPTATDSIARLVKTHSEKSVRFRYPPIEKGQTQENMLVETSKLDNVKFDFRKTPFSVNSSIARMYRSDRISFVSFDNTEQPYKLYTDASVVDSRNPSISSCLLNSQNQILHMISRSIREVDNVATAELIAGYLGLKICEMNNVESVEWYCDNNTVLKFVEGESENKIDDSYISKNIRSIFQRNEQYNNNTIRGSKNKLADSMAKDIRHEEVNDRLEFISPAFKDHTGVDRILSNIEKRTN